MRTFSVECEKKMNIIDGHENGFYESIYSGSVWYMHFDNKKKRIFGQVFLGQSGKDVDEFGLAQSFDYYNFDKCFKPFVGTIVIKSNI